MTTAVDQDFRETIIVYSPLSLRLMYALLFSAFVFGMIFHQTSIIPWGPFLAVCAGAVILLLVLGAERETHILRRDTVTVVHTGAHLCAVLAQPRQRTVRFDDIEAVTTADTSQIIVQMKEGPALRLTMGSDSIFMERWREVAPNLFAVRASERTLAVDISQDRVQRFDIETAAPRSLWPIYTISWIFRWWFVVLVAAIALLALLSAAGASDWFTLPVVGGVVLMFLSKPLFLLMSVRTAIAGEHETTIRLSRDRMAIDHHEGPYATHDLDVALADIARVDVLGTVMVVRTKDGRRGVVAVNGNPVSTGLFTQLEAAFKTLRPDLFKAKA